MVNAAPAGAYDLNRYEITVDTAVTSNRTVAALKRLPAGIRIDGASVRMHGTDNGPIPMETRSEVLATPLERLATLPFSREVAHHAKLNQLDPALVHAVITVESGHNPYAVSPKGATGLMQLMSGTAERFGVRDRRSPADNIRGGTAYLRFLADFFNGNLELMIAAYNAGERAVVQHGHRIPPYAETMEYVPKVLAEYRRLKATASPPTIAGAIKVSHSGAAAVAAMR